MIRLHERPGDARAPLLTAEDDGHTVRLRAAGEHVAAAFAEGLALVAAKARQRVERARARGVEETLMPWEVLNPKPLARVLRALLTRSSRVVAADDRNPIARAAQPWRFDLDDDGTRRALEGPRATRWISRHDDRATLSPDAAVGDDGALDARVEGDTRPLAMRFGDDGDAWLRALPLVEGHALEDAQGLGAWVTGRAGARVSARAPGVVLHGGARRVWVLDDGATEPSCASLATTRAPVADTPFTLRAVVSAGQRVAAGDALATRAAAMGRVASVRWRADLAAGTCALSAAGARALRSAHLAVVDVWVRDTRLGVQELTAAVPGVDAHALRHLDASGVARLGATVEPGELLAGVVTPHDDGTLHDIAVRATARATVVGVEMFLRRGRERCARHAALAEAMRGDLEAERDELLALLAAQGADEARRDAARRRLDDGADAFDRGDDLPPGVVGRTRITLLEERAVHCGDVLADGRGARWSVVDTNARTDAEVELAGAGASGAMYLLSLGARPVAARKRRARPRGTRPGVDP